MTAGYACVLLVFAVLDGAFSGFRSSLGRTGLIRHRASDQRAHLRGAALVVVLLVPSALVAAGAVHHRAAAFTRAGRVMLVVLGPFGVLVLLAIAVYCLLGWRQRYLASAMILGPFTLAQPVVTVAAVVAACNAGRDPFVTASAILAAAAVLGCEPLADRLWYAPGR